MQRNKAKQVIQQAKMEHESSIISDLKSNPKRWHKINISKKLIILHILAH